MPRRPVRSRFLIAAAAVVAATGAPRGASAVQADLVLVDSTAHLGVLAREPMVVEHPRGPLFATGYAGGTDPLAPLHLWRSDDGGSSWHSVDVGTPEEGAAGNSCVDLAVGPEGTLYFLTMGFDREASEGTHITMGVSRDLGASWDWSWLSRDRLDDRPWVDVAPDGTAHVIWNDGAGVSHVVSTDAGRTWTERDRIHRRGGSSHLAVGPAGEVAVRITPASASGNRLDPEADFIAVSTDGGMTWTRHAPPENLVWSGTFHPDSLLRWVEPVAWDESGDLYHLWSEGRDLWLGRSADRGATWERWRIATDEERVMFPYLVARGDGELAATWYSGTGEALRGHVARIFVTDRGAPTMQYSAPIAVNAWQRDGSRRDTGGEYFPVLFLRDGGLGVVTTIQDPTERVGGFTWWRFEPR
ncbi:MAG: sialidase family protein [Gemmatimonadota bacterium]|nr:sialidase family protein [Gemmatimonadota bacterium]